MLNQNLSPIDTITCQGKNKSYRTATLQFIFDKRSPNTLARAEFLIDGTLFVMPLYTNRNIINMQSTFIIARFEEPKLSYQLPVFHLATDEELAKIIAFTQDVLEEFPTLARQVQNFFRTLPAIVEINQKYNKIPKLTEQQKKQRGREFEKHKEVVRRINQMVKRTIDREAKENAQNQM